MAKPLFDRWTVHMTPNGDARGYGDMTRSAAENGIEYSCMSADTYGPLYVDGHQTADLYGVNVNCAYRATAAGKGKELDPPYNFDVPGNNYTQPIKEAAAEYWSKWLEVLPPEYDRRTWAIMLNEVSAEHDHLEYMAEFCMTLFGEHARPAGYRLIVANFNSGEPGIDAWRLPKMRQMVTLAAQYPDEFAIGFHEYSFMRDHIFTKKNDAGKIVPMEAGDSTYGLVGRLTHVFDEWRSMGIAPERVTCFVTEFGFGRDAQTFPDVSRAVTEMSKALDFYKEHRNIIGFSTWAIADDAYWPDLDKRVQPTIEPMSRIMIDNKPYPPREFGQPPAVVLPIEQLSQVDERWADQPVGFGPRTFRTWGCLVVAETMKVNHDHDWDKSPLDVNEDMKAAGAFGTSNDWLVNGHLVMTYPDHYDYEGWSWSTTAGFWQKIDDNLAAGISVVVERDPKNHWFLIVGKTADGDYIINDPLDGEQVRMSERYAVRQAIFYTPVKTTPPPPTGKETAIYSLFPQETTDADMIGYSKRMLELRRSGGFAHTDAETQVMAGKPETSHVEIFDHKKPSQQRARQYFEQHGVPFVIMDADPDPEPVPPPAGESDAVLGAHLSADGWNVSGNEYRKIETMKPGILTILGMHRPQDLEIIRGRIAANTRIVVRAFLSMHNRQITPAQFWNDTKDDVARTLGIFDGFPIVGIQLHNEPNLPLEGLGSSWSNGREYNDWALDVLSRYRASFPTVPMIFAPMSPGDGAGGRIPHREFLADCRPAIDAHDVFGTHVYWSPSFGGLAGDPNAYSGLTLVDDLLRIVPHKPHVCTEASNNSGAVEYDVKTNEYIAFEQALRVRPNQIGFTIFVSEATDPVFHTRREVLTLNQCEDLGRR